MAVKVVITETEYRKGEAVFAAAPDFALPTPVKKKVL